MAIFDMLTGWDYLLALVVVMSFGLGLFRGMIKTVFDLGSWIIAFLAAPLAGPAITGFTNLDAYPWVGLLIGFVAAFFLVRLVGILLSKGLTSVGLAGADRALGGVIGLARAALIITGLATAGTLLDMHRQPAWTKALSRPALELASGTTLKYFPDLQKLKPARSKLAG